MADTEPKTETLTGSPDFKAAVAAAVKEALAAEREAQQAPSSVPDFMAMMGILAKEIASANAAATKEILNSEKRQRGEAVPLSPVEEKAREEARQKMGSLIMDSRKTGAEVPVYRVMAPVWLDEHLIMPYQRVAKEPDPVPVRIRWTGEPNLQLLPVNAAAKSIYSLYLRYLGGTGAINEVINQFGISLTARADQWISEKGRITTVAPSESHRMMQHIESAPLDLAQYEAGAPATGADDALGIITADDPRARETAVLGSIHEKARRGTLTDKVSLQNVS